MRPKPLSPRSLPRAPSRPIILPVAHMRCTSHEPDDDFFYARQGIRLADPQNRAIVDLIAPVQAFESAHLNSTPSADALAEAVAPIRALRVAVDAAEENGVDAKLANRAWGALAEAAERVVRMEGSCASPEGLLAKEILLQAAQHSDPVFDAERDALFAKSPSWGGGAVRIEAAQGIIRLAGNSSCADESVLTMVDDLAGDSVAAVRYQICRWLNAMHETDPDRMWRLVRDRAAHEGNCGVLRGLLSGTFHRLFGSDSSVIADLSASIFGRVDADEAGGKDVSELCIQLLAGAYARTGHDGGALVLNAIAQAPAANKDAALVAVRAYRDAVVYGPVLPPDSIKDEVRHRTLGFVSNLLNTVVREHGNLVAANSKRLAEWPEEARHTASNLVEIAAGIGTELYFGSGAYGASDGSKETDRAVRVRFLQEAGDIIGQLADVGEPSLAHHLLETVEFLIPVDATRAFLLIGRIVNGGRKGGYQYDTLAVNLVVRLVERYLADYRPVLRESPECRRALMDVLDAFVDAGWPAARALAYRLDEMYRL